MRTEVEFDAASGRVIARRRVYWEDLLLEESPAPLPDDEVRPRSSPPRQPNGLTKFFLGTMRKLPLM